MLKKKKWLALLGLFALISTVCLLLLVDSGPDIKTVQKLVNIDLPSGTKETAFVRLPGDIDAAFIVEYTFPNRNGESICKQYGMQSGPTEAPYFLQVALPRHWYTSANCYRVTFKQQHYEEIFVTNDSIVIHVQLH